MFEIPAEKRAKLEEMLHKLHEAADAVSSSHDEVTEKLRQLYSTYISSVERYNAVCEEINVFLDDLQDEIEEFIDEQPGEWQAGEQAGAYQAWLDELSEIELAFIECVKTPNLPAPKLIVEQEIPLSVEMFQDK